MTDLIGLFSLFPFLRFSYNNRRKRMKTRPNGTPFGFVFSFSLWVGVRARHPSFFIQWGISMNIQEQYFKGVPDYYPSMYLDGYTPQQIMYAVRNKMIREYKKRKMATVEPEITEFKITSEVKVKWVAKRNRTRRKRSVNPYWKQNFLGLWKRAWKQQWIRLWTIFSRTGNNTRRF